MARISFIGPAGSIWPPDLFRSLLGIQQDESDPGVVRFLTAAGTETVLTGTGFQFDAAGQPISGTIRSLTVLDGAGQALLRIEGVAVALPVLVRLAAVDGTAVLAHLLRGGDLLVGSAGADTLWGSFGAGPGDDTLRGGAGDDLVHGDAGNDLIAGNSGLDRLDYLSSYMDGTAFQGIRLDVGTGRATDCWGGQDSLSGFEIFGDSALDDTLTGSDASETWFLGAGRDRLDAGAGKDWLDYGEALALGGQRGVLVDLAAGTARDPFGRTDAILGIEGVGGTALDDELRGGVEENQFDGRQGRDRFQGGDGFDIVGFWSVARLGGHGVLIDRTASDGVIRDDGFGNVEQALSIEGYVLSGQADTYRGAMGVDDVSGGEAGDLISGGRGDDLLRGDDGGDTIRGDSGRDWIEGGTGNDDLTGGAGSDSFVFRDFGAQNADTIHGFASGFDRIWLSITWEGMPILGIAAEHLASGAGLQMATTADQRLLYDTATGDLRYDPDGNGGLDSVLVAMLAGHEALTWQDFALLPVFS